MRNFSFKPIKRPDLTSSAGKAYIEKKLKDFNLKKTLRAKIEMSGPITGNAH